jgi:hypothetical protein
MRRSFLAVVAAGALVVAAPAAGDGGPPQNAVQGWDGAARGAFRYVAVPSPGWTSLQVIERRGGRVLKWMNLKGDWGIPSVTPDAGAEALLRDDRTIVLGDATYGPKLRKHSSVLFVDTKRLRVRRTIHLTGHFTFDALSPDGRYLYLTEYVSPTELLCVSRAGVRPADESAPLEDRLRPQLLGDDDAGLADLARPSRGLGLHALRDRRAAFHPRARHASCVGGVPRAAVGERADAHLEVSARLR